jgi:hypothetical protein
MAMNVSGVGATPPAPQPPPVTPVVPTARPEEPGTRGGGSGTAERGRRVPERGSETGEERPSAPPLRMLTVTEMRVMLGQLPPLAAVHQRQHGPADVGKAYG